ncbi:hypothetical protein [Streptomyces sp. bgisy031]|uniref:hypothetical protein n=1 Tax=Streptomyces sp. bgisy031 TaxID=3413772 RepID=UPI003D749E7D
MPEITTRRGYLYAALVADGRPTTVAGATALMDDSVWGTAGRNTTRKDLRGLTRAGLLSATDVNGRRTYALMTGEDGRA